MTFGRWPGWPDFHHRVCKTSCFITMMKPFAITERSFPND
jgi:hypothetical protein